MPSKSKDLSQLQRLSGLNLVNWEMEPSTLEMIIDSDLDRVLDFPLSKLQTFHSLKDLLHENQREDFDRQQLNLVQHKSPIDLKLPIRPSRKWIRLLGEYDSSSDKFTGFILDITDEANKDRLYRNHNLELSAFEKGLEEFSIVARTDPQGKITYANAEFCRLSKYTEEELLGKDHRIVNSGHHPKEFFKEMWSCIKQGTSWRGIVKNKAKDGTFYWVDTIIIPILNTHGELTEILSFRFDVTQLQTYKEENGRLKEELKKIG